MSICVCAKRKINQAVRSLWLMQRDCLQETLSWKITSHSRRTTWASWKDGTRCWNTSMLSHPWCKKSTLWSKHACRLEVTWLLLSSNASTRLRRSLPLSFSSNTKMTGRRTSTSSSRWLDATKMCSGRDYPRTWCLTWVNSLRSSSDQSLSSVSKFSSTLSKKNLGHERKRSLRGISAICAATLRRQIRLKITSCRAWSTKEHSAESCKLSEGKIKRSVPSRYLCKRTHRLRSDLRWR